MRVAVYIKTKILCRTLPRLRFSCSMLFHTLYLLLFKLNFPKTMKKRKMDGIIELNIRE